MSFKISNKQFLKKCNETWKRVEKLLKIEFDSESVYGDDDKYIKKEYLMVVWLQNFKAKKCLKKKHHASVYQNNARFCYQSKKKVLSRNTLVRM